MKGVLHILSGIFMLFLLQSCEETYELDKPYQARLVVNGMFQAEAPWQIEISETVNILRPSDFKVFVDDADVVVTDITEGKSFVLSYDYEQHSYTHQDYLPIEGHQYELDVNHNEYDDVHAVGYCPLDPSINFGMVEEVMNGELSGVNVSFELLQPSLEENFYMWDITLIEGKSRLNGSFEDYHNHPNTLFDNIGSSVLNTTGDYSTTFSIRSSSYFFETNLGGGLVTANNNDQIQTDGYAFSDTSTGGIDAGFLGGGSGGGYGQEGSGNRDKYSLHIISLSKELYNYYNSVIKYESSRPKNTSLHTVQKIDTNIEGGYGVFAGINRHTVTFK